MSDETNPVTIQNPSSSYALTEPTMGLRWYKGVLQQAWTVSSYVDNRKIDTKISWKNIPTFESRK